MVVSCYILKVNSKLQQAKLLMKRTLEHNQIAFQRIFTLDTNLAELVRCSLVIHQLRAL